MPVFGDVSSDIYCTRDELKAELRITDTADDTLLDAAIAAASRQIDGYCGRRFWQDPTVATRYYHADSPRVVLVDDISTASGLVVATDLAGDNTYSNAFTVNTDFVLEPVNALLDYPAAPYTEIHIAPFASSYFPRWPGRAAVKVTAKFGWPAIPDDVHKACLLQSAQLYKAKDTAFGVASFGDAGFLRVRAALNPLAEGLVARYARPAVG